MRNKRQTNVINVVYFTCYWDVKPLRPPPGRRSAPPAGGGSHRLARLQPYPAPLSYRPSVD